MSIFNEITYIEKNGVVFQLHWKERHLVMSEAVVMAAAMVYQGMAANAQGKSEQNMEKYDADVENANAKTELQKGKFEQEQQAEEAAQRQSAMAAKMGASGAVTSEGSPLLVAAKQKAQDELGNLMIGYNAEVAATQDRNQARLDIAQGKIYRQAGQNRATASYIGAGGTLLGGFASQSWGGSGSQAPLTSGGQQLKGY